MAERGSAGSVPVDHGDRVVTVPIDVGPADGFVDGRTHVLTVEGKELAVLRWGDRWMAIRNICPHRGAPLCDHGGLVGPMLGEDSAWSADLTADASRPVVQCPWHRWEFDVASGVDCKGKGRLQTYAVHEVDGRVLVEIKSRARSTPAAA